ncbi:MAG TPA: VOC family protein [Thermoplasmata archaeon]|nr:VOC family protein [Thermoplasmata archaeon]
MASSITRAQLVTLIPVRDMNRAVKFYTKALGGKLTYRMKGKMRNFWASLTLGSNPIWLISPSKSEKRTLAYTTFVVKNIKSTVKDLKKRGVSFQRPEKLGADSRVEGSITYESFGASAFFKDTEGNLLMLWQTLSAW